MARAAQREVRAELKTVSASCAYAERCLVHARHERANLEAKVRNILIVRDAEAKELQDIRRKVAALLVATPRLGIDGQISQECSDHVDHTILRLQEELRRTQSHLAESEEQAVQLREKVGTSMHQIDDAGSDAPRNAQLAPSCREELSISPQHEQVRSSSQSKSTEVYPQCREHPNLGWCSVWACL